MPLGILRRFLHCRPTARSSRSTCCVQVDSPPETPDLAIYSQTLQLAQGNLPTWDSPDIKTNRWSPWRLYQALPITVHNLSPTAHAVRALVQVAVSPFGIGTARTPLGIQRVTIPAASSVELEFPLDQATLDAGPHIGVHVTIEHPHDRSTLNNAGSQLIDGLLTSEDGRSRELDIPVVNDAMHPRTIVLEVHAEDVIAQLAPSSLQLAAGEQSTVTLSTVVPSTIHGSADNPVRRHVHVTARDSAGEVLGGITQIVDIDD